MLATWHHDTEDLENDPTLPPGELPQPDDDEARALRRASARAALFGGEPEPVEVGRYTLLRPIGAGGMGTVFAARDAQLGRTVAVKLLHGGHQRDQARLLREAQALARLSHPNVVAVHEVGTRGDQVFVAMEFVAGKTLEAVIRPDDGARPGWREVLPLLVQAGRGLAAAHAAGIVHRDFKPSNVLVGDDGRVRVLDFGIARTPESEEPPPVDGEEPPEMPRGSLTATGAILGTPGYMPPEQCLGEKVDARGDQFSFCVTLYEAIHGQRPFAGETVAQIMLSVVDGRLRPPPEDSAAPAWLVAAVTRGLSTRPEDRFPSMDALLAELGRDRTPRRGRWWAASIASLAVGLGLWAGQAAPGQCVGGAEALAGVWDAGAKAKVEEGIRASGRPHAASTWDRVSAWGDAWAGRWLTAWRGACESHVRGDRTEAQVEAQRTCLMDQVRTLRSLGEGLAAGDAAAVDRAAAAIRALPEPASCEDAARGEWAPPADPSARAKVDAIESGLAAARAALLLDRVAAVREALAPAIAGADALGDRRLQAAAGELAGALAQRLGGENMAASTWRAAYFRAAEAGDDAMAARLAIRLVRALGGSRLRAGEAEEWAGHASVAIGRLADPRPLTRALAIARVQALLARGEVTGAEDALLPALRDGEDATGWMAAELLLQLGDVRTASEEYEKAEAAYADAGAFYATALGPDHPDFGHVRFAQARLALARGDVAAARRGFTELLSFWTARLGPEHPRVGDVRYALGYVDRVEGKVDAGLDHFWRAFGIFRAALGPDDVRTARAQCGLALRHFGRDERRFREEAAGAEAVLRRARKVSVEEIAARVGDVPGLTRDPLEREAAQPPTNGALCLDATSAKVGPQGGGVVRVLPAPSR